MFEIIMKNADSDVCIGNVSKEYSFGRLKFMIFNVAPCMLPHLLCNPTHALFTL